MHHDTDYFINQAKSMAVKANAWSTTSMETQAQIAVAYAMMAVATELQAQRLANSAVR